MRYFTDSAILLLYSMLAFFYVPADQSLVFSLLFTVILGCVTYLCRTSETESWPYNSLPVLKTSGNILPVLAGSYVVLGSVPCGLRIFFCFSHCFCIRHYLPDFFLLAVVELPFWGLLAFQFHKFPEILCLAGIFGFYPGVFFSGLIPGNMNSLPGISVRAVMTAKNTHFFFHRKKQGASGKTGL